MLWLVTAVTFFAGWITLALHAPEPVVMASGLPMLVAPVLVYVRALRKNRVRWTEALPAKEVEGVVAYRGQPIVPGYVQHVPVRVRVAAASCLLFGIQFVPGLALGLVGLFAAGIGILSLPGLYVAHEMWRAGTSLLERTPFSLDQALRAARAAQMLNMVLLVLTSLGLIVAIFTAEPGFIFALAALFAMVGGAFAQAKWLERVVTSIPAYEPLDTELRVPFAI